MPAFNQSSNTEIPTTTFSATAKEVAQGETLFWKYCGTCHVVNEGGGGLAPDLAYSRIVTDSSILFQVVKEGAYLSLGMPKFGNKLNKEDIINIQKYILTKAREKQIK